MCVICFSPKGVDAPTEDQIEDMFYANPDGAGYAYEEGNTVKYKKGFMTLNDLLEELEPLEQWKDKNLALHFRIGTAGKNDEHTCHPFPITTNYGEMRQTEGEGPVLFHNGILAEGGIINEDSSDTQDFVAAFAPMLKKYSKSKARDKWLEKTIGTSKLLILYGKNKYKMFGDWKKDGDLFVSNLNYYTSTKYYTYDTPQWFGEWEKYYMKKEMKAIAEKMFAELETEDYVWATKYEIECMLENADAHTATTMTVGDTVYNYDFNGELVWSEAANY